MLGDRPSTKRPLICWVAKKLLLADIPRELVRLTSANPLDRTDKAQALVPVRIKASKVPGNLCAAAVGLADLVGSDQTLDARRPVSLVTNRVVELLLKVVGLVVLEAVVLGMFAERG